MLTTVRVLVRRGDEVLGGKRAPGKNPKTSGKNEFLGGQVDPEDLQLCDGDIVSAIMQTAVRELDEEANIEIEPGEPELLGVRRIDDVPDDHPVADATVIEYWCTADYVGGEPRSNGEHEELWWIRPEDAYRNPAFREGTDHMLERSRLV